MQGYQKILLHLSLIENVGPALIQKICARVPREKFNRIYSYLISDFMALGVSELKAKKIFDGLKETTMLDQEIELIVKHKVSFLTVLDDNYPYLLKNIISPPAVLYIWGQNLSDNHTYISMIGSRKAGKYASEAADRLLPSFVANGWITVSGGAYGADTIAHQKTVDLGGPTVVVLGSGLLRPYPPANRKLFEQVLKNNGTIVSIFPMLMEPLPGNFPARNRVIAGLSKGTVVLQAARKSGALITATFALDQGREVFAVPGLIGDELSEGVHDLIKQGACLTTSVEDVFAAFEFIDPKKPAAVEPASNLSFVKNKIDRRFEPVLKVCAQPQSIDEIAALCQMDHVVLHNLLFEMQLEGCIEQTHAGLWQVV